MHFTILDILALAFRGENIKEVAKSSLGYDFVLFSLKISEALFSYMKKQTLIYLNLHSIRGSLFIRLVEIRFYFYAPI